MSAETKRKQQHPAGTSRTGHHRKHRDDVRYREGSCILARYGGEDAWGVWVGGGPDVGQQVAGPFDTLKAARAWCRSPVHTQESCEKRLHAAADQRCEGRDIDDAQVHLVHEGEEELTLWCQECGALLELIIEGERSITRPKVEIRS